MKKVLCLITGLVIAGSILTGCGSNSNSTTTQNNTTAASQSSATNPNGNSQNVNSNSIQGEVTAIKGNTVTLKIIETPKMGDRGMPQNGQNQGTSQSGQTNSTQQSSNGNAQAPNGAPPSGQQSNGTPPSGQQSGGNGGQGQGMQPNYTGETKTITIPDETTITTFSFGSNSGSESKLTISDIKVGDRLMIAYSDSSQKTISKVSIFNMNKGQNQTQSNTQTS